MQIAPGMFAGAAGAHCLRLEPPRHRRGVHDVAGDLDGDGVDADLDSLALQGGAKP